MYLPTLVCLAQIKAQRYADAVQILNVELQSHPKVEKPFSQ